LSAIFLNPRRISRDVIRNVQSFPFKETFILGLGSSVGITTDYELDGPGSNSGGDEIFRQPRPTLGPTQPPVKWVLGLSRGKSAAGACC